MTEFKAPILGLLATFHTESGDILGPVEPRSLELAPHERGFAIVVTFEAGNETGRRVIVTEATINIADSVRHVALDRHPLDTDDGIRIEWQLAGSFDEPDGEAEVSVG